MSPPLSKEQEDKINDLYYSKGFTIGRDRLFWYIQDRFPELNISQRQVMAWLKNQEVHQIFQKPNMKKGIVAPVSNRVGEPGYLQFDEIYLPKDSGYEYALNGIDIFTKFFYSRPLKDKTAKTCAKAMESIIDQAARNKMEIKIVQTDPGGEFQREFADLLKEKGIKHIFSQAHVPQSNSVIERANGVLKFMIFKATANGDKWSKDLQTYVSNINNLRSFATGFTPTQMENDESLWIPVKSKIDARISKRYGQKNGQTPDLKTGVFVRKLKPVEGFYKVSKKGYWSEAVFQIHSAIVSKYPGILTSYKLVDKKGTLVKGLVPRASLLVVPKPS